MAPPIEVYQGGVLINTIPTGSDARCEGPKDGRSTSLRYIRNEVYLNSGRGDILKPHFSVIEFDTGLTAVVKP
jgi:hypothetical protein